MLDSKIEKVRLHFGIENIQDWKDVEPSWITTIHGVGPKTLGLIRTYLSGHGITLKNDHTVDYWKKHGDSATIVQPISSQDTVEINPFKVAIDTREQHPYSFQGYKIDIDDRVAPLIIPIEVKTLATGDYSIVGMENRICVERKSLNDLYGTLGHGRARFEAEFNRMSKMDFAAVVVESTIGRAAKNKCYNCAGVGYVISGTCKVELNITKLRDDFGSLHREVRGLVESGKCDGEFCGVCDGTGFLKANPNAKMSPKTLTGTWNAWMQRYKNVHWAWCDNRALAEKITFRILERFWNDSQSKERA